LARLKSGEFTVVISTELLRELGAGQGR
jgi:hypothetical protein